MLEIERSHSLFQVISLDGFHRTFLLSFARALLKKALRECWRLGDERPEFFGMLVDFIRTGTVGFDGEFYDG